MLVVEDNEDHALLVRLAAKRSRPENDVRVARDGRQGIAYLAETAPFLRRKLRPYPDLVVLDLVMPGADGLSMLEWMHAQQRSEAPPVAVLTSSMSPREEAKALALGAKSFHTKPPDVEGLSQVVLESVRRWIR